MLRFSDESISKQLTGDSFIISRKESRFTIIGFPAAYCVIPAV